MPNPNTPNTPEHRDREAANRSRARRKGLVYLGGAIGGRPVPEVLLHVAGQRQELDELEREAVLVGRRHGLSWDRLSALLGGTPTGEGLRYRYSDLTAEVVYDEQLAP